MLARSRSVSMSVCALEDVYSRVPKRLFVVVSFACRKLLKTSYRSLLMSGLHVPRVRSKVLSVSNTLTVAKLN